jgi:cytidyltransferase-like protein
MTDTQTLIREFPKGLLKWFPFSKEEKIIYIGSASDAYYEALVELGHDVICVSLEESVQPEWNGKYRYFFDCLVSVAELEKAANPDRVLGIWKELLIKNGRLLLGMNNRFGIRYFCGDRDPYTDRNFDGIENYRRYFVKKEDVLTGREYNRAELEMLLDAAGWTNRKFYSVFPDLDAPSFIFAEEYIPNEELSTRCFPRYHYPDTVFLEEEFLYSDLIKNGMFHKMANAFLIECYKDEICECSDIEHVTMSLDRGQKDALFTIIHNNGIVEKRAAYEEGMHRLDEMLKNSEDLKAHGVEVVQANIDGKSYKMPFVESETALIYLQNLAHTDVNKFVREMDGFRTIILKSSEHVTIKQWNKDVECLKKGYIDLVPINCFAVDGEYLFYDQEFCIENCPIDTIVMRLIDFVYGDIGIESILPRQFFYTRYGIEENKIRDLRWVANNFLIKLRKETELATYYETYRRNPEVVNANRQRMNYSEEEYQRKFVDIFRNLGDRKLILFGSGAFTKRFIAMYGKSYEIACILDNNEDRLGQRLDGYEIKSPEYLNELSKEDYKVLICIKSYVSVAKQLESMGITDYGIFDTSRSYAKPAYRQEGIDSRTALPARAARPQQAQESGTEMKKKYHIGYVAGVFDMFHTGHVRLLQRAKKLCDYLIVGVVSDEDCYRQKNKYPVISCEDRVEVVKACRYVDQVEALPTGFGGIRDAYKMFQFDVQFSGDDHGDDGSWLAEKEYLNKHGADLVFFDYTKGISSTEIRERL